MKTKAVSDEFKGNILFAIYETDDDGEIIAERPIISFGKKKAKALLVHLNDFEDWCEENGVYGDEE